MKLQAAATHTGANAFAAIIVAVYLAIVAYQGNIGALFGQLKTDFLGTSSRGGFWKWAIALVILYWLAENPATNEIFGPLLMLALLAMLIDVATTQPGAFKNLNAAVASIFSTAAPSPGTSSQLQPSNPLGYTSPSGNLVIGAVGAPGE